MAITVNAKNPCNKNSVLSISTTATTSTTTIQALSANAHNRPISCTIINNNPIDRSTLIDNNNNNGNGNGGDDDDDDDDDDDHRLQHQNNGSLIDQTYPNDSLIDTQIVRIEHCNDLYLNEDDDFGVEKRERLENVDEKNQCKRSIRINRSIVEKKLNLAEGTITKNLDSLAKNHQIRLNLNGMLLEILVLDSKWKR
ncbi:hypothetical protein QR98_0105520 [Sarcoptes scabiei]|uniref:Uncharacterized protein n=1 Tax=Sarcoptes scabiei TaxID=52283 RepID=A0A132ALT5_SARSC|nr:hypothetical protein QR98_0105520 [Sarcoptes scabiei]